jgi:hypothetical protein
MEGRDEKDASGDWGVSSIFESPPRDGRAVYSRTCVTG